MYDAVSSLLTIFFDVALNNARRLAFIDFERVFSIYVQPVPL